MREMKTPGVYIVEKNAFPNSVVEAATAIPIFIGFTEKTMNGTNSLLLKPTKVSSMTEYNGYFGGMPLPKFRLEIGDKSEKAICSIAGKDEITYLNATLEGSLYTLYYNMIMFFANGGGTCYIVSMGGYDIDPASFYTDENKYELFSNLKKVEEITVVVVPEAVNNSNCMNIYTDVLAHCEELNRFAILDIPPAKGGDIDDFRDKIGLKYLFCAAAYYPWLETSVLSDSAITAEMFIWDIGDVSALSNFAYTLGFVQGEESLLMKYVKNSFVAIGKEREMDEKLKRGTDLHKALLQHCTAYRQIVKKVKEYLNHLPPSAAMAGIYTMVDNTRGVWKAPANVSVNYVNRPSVDIDNRMQEELNMPINGKAVNAIRMFVAEGVKVWGARTLNGNSPDYRYINVRRTMTFLEHSMKNAVQTYVYEPNDANTWNNIKCMLENFCAVFGNAAVWLEQLPKRRTPYKWDWAIP